MDKKISWRALEYKRMEKTNDWYWAVGIIALSGAIIAFIKGDGLFAILILIGTATLIMFSVTEPAMFNVTLNERGITVGKDSYPFANLSEFWIDITNEHEHKVLIKSKKGIMPLIVIPLEDHHHLLVREFLLQYLPEKEMHEPVSHKIMERLGF